MYFQSLEGLKIFRSIRLNMSWFLCCVAFILILQYLFQCAEAASSLPRDRVIRTYNEESDRCNRITDSSDRVEIDSADWACEEAFKALDDIGHNSCQGWRSARCRHLKGYKKPQCTCTFSHCTWFDIRYEENKTFRECASEIWTEEVFSEEVRPSVRFQEAWRRSESALATSRALPTFNLGRSGSSGTSYEAAPFLGAGSSSSNGVGSESGTVESTTAKKVGTEKIYCKPCNKSFSSKGNLTRHNKDQHREAYIAGSAEMTRRRPGSGKYKCQHCPASYVEKGALTSHYKRRHPESQEGVASLNRGGPKIYECDVCGVAYCGKRSLYEHKRSHSEDFTCYSCNLDFGTKGNFDRHVHAKHSNLEDPNEPDRRKGRKRIKTDDFCYLCKKKLASKWNLERHVESRHPKEQAAAFGRDPERNPQEDSGILKSS